MTGRFDRAVFAFDQFLKKPIFGWGPGALDALTSRQFRVGGFNTSHNTFLTIMVDGGLLVFLSFAALSTYWLWQGVQVFRRNLRHSFERTVTVTMMGSILIFLFSGISLELKFFSYFNAVLWIAAATIESQWQISAKNEEITDLIGATWTAP